MKRYEYVEHTADAEFYAYGESLEEAFAHALYAVAGIMVDCGKVRPAIGKTIKVRGKDEKALLYNAIEELIFLLDTQDFLMHRVQYLQIKKDENGFALEAGLMGDDVKNCEPLKAIKAATYNQMEIKQDDEKWIVHAVVDI